MSIKWILCLTAAAFCSSLVSSPSNGQAAPPMPTQPPPQANLKLIPVERLQSEDFQVWIETTSLVRKGNLANVWTLRVNQYDKDALSGKNTAVWLRMIVDCQQRTTMDQMVSSISPTGEVRKTYAFSPKPPVTPRPNTSDPKVIDTVCNAPSPGSPFADAVSVAVSSTRNGTRLPKPAAASAKPLSAWMKRECSVNYMTLSDLAGLRRNQAYLGEEISKADIAALEAAEKAFKERSYQTDPTLPGLVAASESIRRYKDYEHAPGGVHSPAKMAALNRLQYAAEECDKRLGLTAIALP
jgi:hypothetical protein